MFDAAIGGRSRGGDGLRALRWLSRFRGNSLVGCSSCRSLCRFGKVSRSRSGRLGRSSRCGSRPGSSRVRLDASRLDDRGRLRAVGRCGKGRVSMTEMETVTPHL